MEGKLHDLQLDFHHWHHALKYHACAIGPVFLAFTILFYTSFALFDDGNQIVMGGISRKIIFATNYE